MQARGGDCRNMARESLFDIFDDDKSSAVRSLPGFPERLDAQPAGKTQINSRIPHCHSH